MSEFYRTQEIKKNISVQLMELAMEIVLITVFEK